MYKTYGSKLTKVTIPLFAGCKLNYQYTFEFDLRFDGGGVVMVIDSWDVVIDKSLEKKFGDIFLGGLKNSLEDGVNDERLIDTKLQDKLTKQLQSLIGNIHSSWFYALGSLEDYKNQTEFLKAARLIDDDFIRQSEKVVVGLNSSYTATVSNSSMVQVGCQSFHIDNIKQIVAEHERITKQTKK